MKKKLERQRLSLRLPIQLLDKLEHFSEKTGKTRTKICEEALELLCRDLMHDVYDDEFLKTLHKKHIDGNTKLTMMRLPKMYINHLQLNCYNITTCLKTALSLYKHL